MCISVCYAPSIYIFIEYYIKRVNERGSPRAMSRHTERTDWIRKRRAVNRYTAGLFARSWDEETLNCAVLLRHPDTSRRVFTKVALYPGTPSSESTNHKDKLPEESRSVRAGIPVFTLLHAGCAE